MPGDLSIDELIEKIKDINNDIKIIILLFKYSEELKKSLLKKGVYRILINNEINIENIFKIINMEEKMKKYNEEILEEINKIKNNKIKKSKIEIIKKMFNKKNNKFNSKKNIISIIGNNGAGKTIFSILLSESMKKYYNKILLFDFNYLNNSLQILNKKNNNLINKTNKNIYLFSDNYFFIENNKFNFEKLKIEIKKLSKEYDLIIFDTSSENLISINKEIISISDNCIFLTEANLFEINKCKKILEKIVNKWEINIKKVNIIINKYNKYSVNKILIKKIFLDFNILGFIKYDKKINYLINTNFKEILIKNYYKKLIKKIIYNLFLERKENGIIKQFRKRN